MTKTINITDKRAAFVSLFGFYLPCKYWHKTK